MKELPRIAGEVQRYQMGPDGDEWVRAQDYADLNEYSALVEMKLQAEVERLHGASACSRLTRLPMEFSQPLIARLDTRRRDTTWYWGTDLGEGPAHG
jgi:hypothetical protein